MSEKLTVGQRVELLPGREDVYTKSFPASPGVVGGTRIDGFGEPQVYILWDKDHWRYNGEKDGWTFEAHFRPIEGEEEIIDMTYEIPQTAPTEQQIKDEYYVPESEETERMEEYLDALMAAADTAAESDAFFFVCLKGDASGKESVRMLYAIGDPRLKKISIADVFAFAEREMRRKGM